MLLVGIAMTVVSGNPSAQEPAAGKVESLHGDAFADTGGSRRALRPAASIFLHDLIETEALSGLIMSLGRATTVKLGALAKLRIDKFVIDAGGLLDLEQGALVIDRNEDAKKERLQVRSPFGLIAVRGTLLFAGPTNGVFGVFVVRGAATVVAAGRTVSLYSEQGTEIVQAGAAPTAPKKWAPERVSAAFGSAG
jgi:hypothetical protein